MFAAKSSPANNSTTPSLSFISNSLFRSLIWIPLWRLTCFRKVHILLSRTIRIKHALKPRDKAFRFRHLLGQTKLGNFLITQRGQPHGFGRMYNKNGSVFVGEFFNGVADGQGHFVMSDGSYYEGRIRNNLANDTNGFFWSPRF